MFYHSIGSNLYPLLHMDIIKENILLYILCLSYSAWLYCINDLDNFQFKTESYTNSTIKYFIPLIRSALNRGINTELGVLKELITDLSF